MQEHKEDPYEYLHEILKQHDDGTNEEAQNRETKQEKRSRITDKRHLLAVLPDTRNKIPKK